jgi:hypothetical protein
MKPLLIAGALLASTATRAQSLTELWDLQSKCAKLAQAKLDDVTQYSGKAWSWSVTSRYRADESRCYVEISGDLNTSGFDMSVIPHPNAVTGDRSYSVYDGQTDDMLAHFETNHGKKVGWIFDDRFTGDRGLGDDLGFSIAAAYAQAKLGK